MPDARTFPAAPPKSIVAEPDRPPSLEQIKTSLAANHADVEARLVNKRRQRDRLNDEIRVLVAEEAEARRLLNALQPKTRKAKK